MKTEDIQAIGNFLMTYHSDLTYIHNFQLWKQGKISDVDYIKKSKGSFYQFLIEFKVTRNFNKGESSEVLAETKKWIKKPKSDYVDSFAEKLMDNGLTRNKIMTSLASKILFLNNPWAILPMDNLAKNAVGQKEDNFYKSYTKKVEVFNSSENKKRIKSDLEEIKNYLKVIEADFKSINDIKLIRENRYLDKLLWTIGQTKTIK
ncbi:MAG: hypothetical protein NTX03_11065 [Bacteroidetes bacterium]|nr:hypothetical protein [Bacteroidota bacterium]